LLTGKFNLTDKSPLTEKSPLTDKSEHATRFDRKVGSKFYFSGKAPEKQHAGTWREIIKSMLLRERAFRTARRIGRSNARVAQVRWKFMRRYSERFEDPPYDTRTPAEIRKDRLYYSPAAVAERRRVDQDLANQMQAQWEQKRLQVQLRREQKAPRAGSIEVRVLAESIRLGWFAPADENGMPYLTAEGRRLFQEKGATMFKELIDSLQKETP
jgi:hypothetical protein